MEVLSPIKEHYPLVYRLLKKAFGRSMFITKISLSPVSALSIKAYNLDIDCYKDRQYRFVLPVLSGVSLVKREWEVIEDIFTRCMEQSYGSLFRDVLISYLHAVFPESVRLLDDEVVKLEYGSNSRKVWFYKGEVTGLINLDVDVDSDVVKSLCGSGVDMIEVSLMVPSAYYYKDTDRYIQKQFLEDL